MRRSVFRSRPACRAASGRTSLLLTALFLLFTPLITDAQLAPGGVYAVRNARLVTAPGRVIERGTVVVRGGLIEALGRNVQPPPDAVILDGEGLTVYPGFIDAFSQAGLALLPARERDPAPNISDHDASEWFDPAAENLEAYRQQGFTTALVARNDGVFAGQAVLMNLLGDDPGAMTVKSPVVQVLTYSGQRGYPGTLMAVVAFQRQTLIDAQYQDMLLKRYSRQSQGMERPAHEPALEAIIPQASGQAPFLVDVGSENDLKRLRALGEEFGIRFWITGAQEGYRVVDLMKGMNAPVIVSLDLPSPQNVTGYWFNRAYRNLSDEESRELDELDSYAIQGNAATLVEAGLTVALSTGGMSDPGRFLPNLRLAVKAGLSPEEALKALTTTPASLFGVAGVLGTLEAGKIANLTVTSGDLFTSDDAFVSHVIVDGRMKALGRAAAPARGAQGARNPGGMRPPPVETNGHGPLASSGTANGYGPQAPSGDLLIRGGTVLTITNGDMPNTDVLIRNGRIAEIGQGLRAPRGVQVIDAAGRFVMPAIIDDHSHMGVDGGINEGSRAVVPEADVADVIAHDDPSFLTALAGGVAVIHTMHGSANPIGARNEVIKLKWGRPWEELVFEEAPSTLKFALGENVRQTSRPDGTRYPRTRSGVAEMFRDMFTRAEDYRDSWAAYEAARAGGADPIPPKRDLQLEVLVGLLEGEIIPRCHTYRADETVMFMEVCEEFGIPAGTFEHVLAGYMVAPELAEKGWHSSIFADSWGYKIEAYDAIPFKASIMYDAGARVDMNSDSAERVRRLYQEAARAVRYGGVPENEALKMVTLNPAMSLRVEDHMGSVEVGKDGTLAIFSHYPLHAPARCEMTIIDGEVFFDRSKTDTAADWVEGFDGDEVPEDTETYPGRHEVDFGLTDTSVDDYALVGGTVVPVTGAPIPNGIVLVRDGKIAAVGASVSIPAGVERIDVSGKYVYPGLIDAGTSLGLQEAGGMAGSQDLSELGDYNPDLEAYIAVNQSSEMLESQRVGGITTVMTGLTSGIISGYDSLIDLWGWTPSSMTQERRAGLRVNWPGGRGGGRGGFGGQAAATAPPVDRVEELRNWFREAKAYASRREMAARGEIPDFANDLRMEALGEAATGNRLVILEASSEQQIRDAVAFAEEMGLRYAIRGAGEAWMMTDFLKEHDVKLIFGGVHSSPGRDEPYDIHYATPAILYEAGIDFALMSDSAANAFSVTYEAGMATAFGLPTEKALEILTIAPARILGVDDRLGSIEVGKVANLIVTTGNPIAYTTQVHMMFIRGVKVPWDDKFSRHWQKYGARNGK